MRTTVLGSAVKRYLTSPHRQLPLVSTVAGIVNSSRVYVVRCWGTRQKGAGREGIEHESLGDDSTGHHGAHGLYLCVAAVYNNPLTVRVDCARLLLDLVSFA